MSNYRKRVERGVKLLNKFYAEVLPYGNWTYFINREALDMDDGSQCILGQLFRNYELGCTIIQQFNHKDANDFKYGLDGGTPTEAWLKYLNAV